MERNTVENSKVAIVTCVFHAYLMKSVLAAESNVAFICTSRGPQGNELPELVLGRLNWLGATLYLLSFSATVQKNLIDCSVCVLEKEDSLQKWKGRVTQEVFYFLFS